MLNTVWESLAIQNIKPRFEYVDSEKSQTIILRRSIWDTVCQRTERKCASSSKLRKGNWGKRQIYALMLLLLLLWQVMLVWNSTEQWVLFPRTSSPCRYWSCHSIEVLLCRRYQRAIEKAHGHRKLCTKETSSFYFWRVLHQNYCNLPFGCQDMAL